MAMSDCEKCWSTPCSCGWGYKEYAAENLCEHIASITQYRSKGEAKAIIERALKVVDEIENWQPGVVICHCGAIIPDDNIDKWNGCNEEGEEFGTVTANCDKCGANYETAKWGEWDDLEDDNSYLQEYIKTYINLSKLRHE